MSKDSRILWAEFISVCGDNLVDPNILLYDKEHSSFVDLLVEIKEQKNTRPAKELMQEYIESNI